MAREDSQSVTLVVAEDEALIRMDLVEMLAAEGYIVIGQAGDGETAVALAEDLRPDVVLLDMKMPVLDGLSAAERIKAADIAPVVMLTAFSQRELVDRAVDAGVMGYVVKPFTQGDLSPAIEIARSRWRELHGAEARATMLEQRLAARTLIDRAKALLQRQGLTEEEAFRHLQRSAMNGRTSMADVAAGLLGD